MIDVGYSPPFKGVNNKEIDTLFSTWTLDDSELAKLNTKCLKCFYVC